MAKYDPLRDFLRRRTTPITMTFDEVADLVGGLPRSAYDWPLWWRNDDPHVQAQAWGAAGFDAEVDLARRVVRFTPKH
ncbi:MAG TPA: hypothetical protein VIS06_05000 [Mycobacteriales bacterium]|jgi:hypothetical protein